MERFLTEEARQTRIIAEADTVVVGGGTAGCIAAIAAARSGASVVLIEKTPVPGGTMTNGGICFNSLYASTPDTRKARQIVFGLPDELERRMEEEGGSSGPVPTRIGNSYSRPYMITLDHEVFKYVICDMLMEAGVKVYLQTMFAGIRQDADGRITAVLVQNKSGRGAILTGTVIDCTGDGDVAKAAGCPQKELWNIYEERVARPTGMVFALTGVDWQKVYRENKDCLRLGDNSNDIFVGEGERHPSGYLRMNIDFTKDPKYQPITDLDIHWEIMFMSMKPGEATYVNGLAGPTADQSDAETLSNSELEVRVKIHKLAKALRECVPGFENSHVTWEATQLGVRASWVTLCEKDMTLEYMLEGKRFEDEIGLYGYQDILPRYPDIPVGGDGYYGFPYRMILPKDSVNLFIAGRCVTPEPEAHMSTRNVVSCMIQGEAAGTAAALCAKAGCLPRQLPYEDLRAELICKGVKLEL